MEMFARLNTLVLEIPSKFHRGCHRPNGAGKTTLLLGLAGLFAIDGGTIYWNDRAIQDALVSHSVLMWRTRSGPMHSSLLLPTLGFLQLRFQRTKAHCDDVIDRLRLRDFLRSRVCDLSKGTANVF